MRILLAPMEGVVDHTMRETLTGLSSIDRCVTEFVRVTDHTLPERIFIKYCPELLNEGKTAHGVPVYVQLLGDNPQALANNAKKAAQLGAPGIDLNFGCPAKTVNQRGGGAVLLQTPDKIHRIVEDVRSAVPKEIPVTAKIRLGYEDKSLALINAAAVFEGGASELIVHGRTKMDGYKPPADWEMIAKIADSVSIPVIANGEIWTVEDALRCQQISQCEDIMLGRGILTRPDLARAIKQPQTQAMTWGEVMPMLILFFDRVCQQCPAKFCGNLIKQWLGYLRKHYTEAGILFEKIKRITLPEKISLTLYAHNMDHGQ